METELCSSFQLPPGFRFHPSDEELILQYLKNKATSNPLPPSIIADVELYKFDPWELPKKAFFGEEEWYFFTPRDRKYPKGARPNRMAATGYWKATGTDRPVFDSRGSRIIGVKKALVFYSGRPPRGAKSEWIMDEYRLVETMPWTSKKKESMRLDNWVLCRVRQKNGITRNNRAGMYSLLNEPVDHFPANNDQSSMNTNPRTKLLRDSLFKDCPMLPFIFGSQTDFFEKEKATPSENYSSGENLRALFPSFNNLKDSKKRKNGETNQQDSSIQFQHNKKITERDGLLDELLSLSTDDDAIDMNINSKNKLETDVFNADQWNLIMQYQELDHIALA